MKTIITKMSIIGLIVLMMASCKKDMEMPSGEFVNIKTNEVTDVTAVSAVVSAYVGAGCDERGVCWSESANPTIDDSYVSNGKGKGDYTCLLTNLTPNKKYYCKAYGKCGTKYVYSQQTKNFTTKDGLPTIVTGIVSDITATSAKCNGEVTDGGGNVTDDDGFPVTARGVCWSTSQNPTVAGNHTTDGGGTGTFTSELTGLAENTTYYVRAYATNSYGTGYGEQKSFTTLQTFTVNGVTFEMVAVKGGTFTMGATSEQGSDAESDEKPTHSVTLSDYYIGEFEVTQELWEAVMGSNPSSFNGSNLPVETVSWDDSQEFITKLNGLTGKNFRLPTEAEWEYAARGGNRSGGYKYSGSNNINDVAWYDNNSGSKTHAVGTKSPNELGIYDMSGNVYEWCQDWYGSYSSGSQTNPQGPSSGSYRVNRGGSWISNARSCRVSNRYNNAPVNRNDYLGLRLAL